MKNQIELEKEISKEFDFKLIKNTKLPEISIRNVALVEAMLRYNSQYSNIYGNKSKKDYIELKNEIRKNKLSVNTLFNIIKSINNQNSTRASKSEWKDLAIVIKNYNDKERKLISFLKNPDADYSLVKKLSEPTKSKKRRNFSLATKICQTLCLYLFEGKKEQDNFCKFDSVMKYKIPKYMRAYKISVKDVICENKNSVFYNEYLKFCIRKKKKQYTNEELYLMFLYDQKKDYSKYMFLINALIKRACKGERLVSKNGLDHLIWYYNK